MLSLDVTHKEKLNKMNESIPLSQKLYLLAINPQKGGIISASYTAMDYVLIGTLFLELYQNKNINFENKRIVVLNTKSDNSLHQFLLEKISKSKRPLRISRWINKLYFSLKHIKTEVQLSLVEKRIIRMQPKQFLFFKWEKPFLINKQVVYKLVAEIEKLIFNGTASEDEIILLSFLKPAGLLRWIFPERDKRKKAKTKLKQLMVDNPVSIAVADAISAAHAVAASAATVT